MNILKAMDVERYRTMRPMVQTKVIRVSSKNLKATEDVKQKTISKEFILAEIRLSDVAITSPVSGRVSLLASSEDKPIIVDVNKHKVGKTPCGYCPSVVLLAGADRYNRAKGDGQDTIQAWVGVNASKYIKSIYADHQFGSNELRSAIDEVLREKLGPKSNDKQSAPVPYPYVVEVYPFENYFVYSLKGELYRQKYKPDVKKRTVTFDGDPKLVVQKYVDIDASAAKGTRLDVVMALGSGPAGPAGASMQEGSNPLNVVRGGISTSPSVLSPGSGVGPRVTKDESKKVAKIVTKEKMKAGGVGSGSKPMAGFKKFPNKSMKASTGNKKHMLLKDSGWKQSAGSDAYANATYKGHAIRVDAKGRWVHSVSGSNKVVKGKSSGSLVSHLERIKRG